MDAPRESVSKRSSANPVTLRKGFGVLDTMILVMAAAIGCRITLSVCHDPKRSALDEFCELFLEWPAETSVFDCAMRCLGLALLAMPVMTMMSLASIPIRLQRPRPRGRRLTRQPGLLAMSAVALALVFVGLPTVLAAAAAGATWQGLVSLLPEGRELWDLTILVGLAVLASWMTLLVGRSWCAEPSAVDRMGRALGVSWIVAGFAVGTAGFLIMILSSHCGIRVKPSALGVIGRSLLRSVHFMMPIIAAMTLAVIPIRLLGPGLRWRRLTRQPGLLAACAAAATMALAGTIALAGLTFYSVVTGSRAVWIEVSKWAFCEDNVTLVTMHCGLAVSASWMTLMVSRRWRAESSWVDRLGRAVGVCWIAAAFAVATSNALIGTDFLRYREP